MQEREGEREHYILSISQPRGSQTLTDVKKSGDKWNI